jgi:hypothetical protein
MSFYNFIDKDFRRDTTLYMYSPYCGQPLLDEYVICRKENIYTLKEKYTKGNSILGDILMSDTHYIHDLNKPSPCGVIALPGSENHNTLEILQKCIFALLYKDGDNMGAVTAWIEIFIRKIEIARRLWFSYGTGMKPLLRFDAGIQSYALLAALLALGLGSGVWLKRLNALLKTNDFLIHSRDQVYNDYLSISCMHLSLSTEVGAVASLEKLRSST